MSKVKVYSISQVLVMWAWANHGKFTPILYHKKLHRMLKQLLRECYSDCTNQMSVKNFEKKWGFRP